MNALLYLELQSRANAVRGWLQRLRQPRYALGALGVGAYFAFALRPLTAGDAPSRRSMFGALFGTDLAVFALLLLLAWGWIFGAERAALAFTQAEVALLFPAPIERRALVHYRLLKLQFGVIIGALFYAAFLANVGAGFWQRALGFWVLLTFYGLHDLARSFTRERLLGVGLGTARRRLAFGALFVAVLALSLRGAAARAAAALPTPSLLGTLASALAGALETPPLAWLLAPLRLLVAPLHAETTAALLTALAPALALLALHYAWALRAMVGFEEASIALSEKRAAMQHAVRSGRTAWAVRERSVQGDPFALPPRGRPELAFLWQRVIASGSWAAPRSLIALATMPIAVVVALSAWAPARPLLGIARYGAAFVGAYGLALAPPLFRGSIAQLLERMDATKSYPLRGWQVVLGELLAPIALLGLFEVTLMTVAAIATLAVDASPAPALVAAAWVAAVSTLVPLGGLLFAVQLGLQLALPAWFGGSPGQAGFEVGGQRLLFVMAGALAFAIGLLPAGAAGAASGAAVLALGGAPSVAIVLGAGAAAVAIAAELALLLAWLGRRFERIDPASDLAR